MGEQSSAGRYHWLILQDGQLPLHPDGTFDFGVEHRCTVTLIWPEGSSPTRASSLLVDPCLTDTGYAQAEARLRERGLMLDDAGRVLVTHLHGDHLLHTPYNQGALRLLPFRFAGADDPLVGVRLVDLPGHYPMLLAPGFVDPDGRRVLAVADAALNEDWVRAWGYYWPNRYLPPEIVQTWRSLALLLSEADLIIPGHGAPFAVTAELVAALIEAFPNAAYANQCPDVRETLRARLDELRGSGS